MKIGILTSGGDTPGMNSVIRAAYIKCQQSGHELVGIQYGWKGLIENITITIPESIIDDIGLGGTILGSSRVNPFKDEKLYLEKIKQTIDDNQLVGIIAIGGEDTLGAAYKLYEKGFPMVGVPKTIDNDLDGTDYTFGFNTAISIISDAFDRLKTTAKSHERVMVLEIMGRHAGWLALYGGIAGGAHVILLPEFEVSNEDIFQIIKSRYDNGNKWALVAVSEGYGFTESDASQLEKDEFGHVLLEKMAIGARIAKLIEKKLNVAARATVLGHIQRGGSPSAYDRVLTTKLGIKSVELVINKNFGTMPGLKSAKIEIISLKEAISVLKVVDSESWKFAQDIMGINS